MSIKLKALLQLIGLIAAAFAGAGIVHYLTVYVPAETIWTGIQFGLLGGLLYMCYGLLLARLAYQQTLEDLNKKG